MNHCAAAPYHNTALPPPPPPPPCHGGTSDTGDTGATHPSTGTIARPRDTTQLYHFVVDPLVVRYLHSVTALLWSSSQMRPGDDMDPLSLDRVFKHIAQQLLHYRMSAFLVCAFVVQRCWVVVPPWERRGYAKMAPAFGGWVGGFTTSESLQQRSLPSHGGGGAWARGAHPTMLLARVGSWLDLTIHRKRTRE